MCERESERGESVRVRVGSKPVLRAAWKEGRKCFI